MNLCNIFKKLYVTILLYCNQYYIKKLIAEKKGLSRIVPLFRPSPQLDSKNKRKIH